ncbi:MAG: D-glucuronyl C5-epimerase family protein [Lagierella massiliensis]|nr:D-glucuronyl C5-epimerase family protein [Lagierella massiliensis]
MDNFILLNQGAIIIKKRILLIVTLLFILTSCQTNPKEISQEDLEKKIWNKANLNQEVVSEKVKEAVKQYKNQKQDYNFGLEDYESFGTYMNYFDITKYKRIDNVAIDRWGLPVVQYGDSFHYNPVTLSQFALSSYSDSLKHREDPSDNDQFFVAVDKILSMMDQDGAFRYTFKWYNYNSGEDYPIGWVSSMAQGQVMSVLSRAYYITKDQKYLDYANKAMGFLLKPVEDGGVRTDLSDVDPTLKDYIFFEEYVSKPDSYTLNGYIFTLLGIYDYKEALKLAGNIEAHKKINEYFDSGIKSLLKIIDFYDVGGFTNYDLGYINFDVELRLIPSYHAVHIRQMHALYSITGEEKFKEKEELWKSYVD